MALVKWNPFRSLTALDSDSRNLFDEVFGDFFSVPMMSDGNWLPRMDMRDTKDNIELSAELPGMKKEDIKITYENGLLTISGERKREEKDGDHNYYCIERRFGSFSRSVKLPIEVQADKIKANYNDGILHLTLPKAEARKPHEIPILTN
jgi:HSP20 family protein